ncbi:hypothetical protein L1987_18614 [Smallanthus sonchifolius]|uniref:Uncharacterized protein n=1 Tax=Smallanthus sonchifolius TaxID=185202 RepID=A0ACB9J032_9ASTR|nr:hypothetical protein L1987_18614 [Smallanthus sonchifolius]
MKCLISLNLPDLLKEFVLNRDKWKDQLLSAVVWEGQEIVYERMVKLKMDGLPLVLREENTYRGIAGLYGRVIEPFHFSWDEFDVSSGSYMPPELKEGTIFANEGEKEPVLDEEMGLEEGEFWPIVEQNMGPEYAPDVEQSENLGEGEPIRHSGEAEGLRQVHGEGRAAHDMGETLCTPRNTQSKVVGFMAEQSLDGPNLYLGQLTCPSSRKRARNRRSPVSIDSPSVQNQGVGSRRSFNIPPFLDLNNPAIGCPGPFDDSSTSVSDIREENPEDGPGTLVPETQSVEGYANFDKEVADTMEIGKKAR